MTILVNVHQLSVCAGQPDPSARLRLTCKSSPSPIREGAAIISPIFQMRRLREFSRLPRVAKLLRGEAGTTRLCAPTMTVGCRADG